MKKVLFLVTLCIVVYTCKNDVKSEGSNELESIETDTNTTQKEQTNSTQNLPENVVQLNSEEYQFPIEEITLTKVQVENTKDDDFVYKLFFRTDQLEKFKAGSYSFFVQNIAYESDNYLLDEKDQEKGMQSFWMNMSSAKKYKEEYVVFKSFNSRIISFEKIVIGVMDLSNKRDVFRVSFDHPIILN